MGHKKKIVTACALLSLVAANPAAAAFKCWTNADGVRECGNAVPPEYAQQGSRTINERGMTIDVQERAKTEEELARERAEIEAREAAEAEAKRLQEESERHDRVLLATFTSEKELLASRDRKLASIQATIEVTQATMDNLSASMNTYRRKAADLERVGKPVPEDLLQDIASLQQQLDDKAVYIANREREVAELKDQYQSDLLRFRELKALQR